MRHNSSNRKGETHFAKNAEKELPGKTEQTGEVQYLQWSKCQIQSKLTKFEK